MPPPIRILMLGTGDFALPTFLHLLNTRHNVVTLVTQPDRPQGRKQELIPSAIKLAAITHEIPVFQPENVNAADSLAAIRAWNPDLLVTAAYGQILSAELLLIPRLSGINLHGSILPAYRGAAPVARAIQNGEIETGITVIFMTPRIDAGGMLKVLKTSIDPNETAGMLEDRLAKLGAPLVTDAIAELAEGVAKVIPQQKSKVTKAPKLRKEDGLIEWSHSARSVHDQVRAMQPWPVAYSYLYRTYQPDVEPLRVIIHQTEPLDLAPNAPPGTILTAIGDLLVVATGSDAVRVLDVQIAGKKTMPASDFLRGHRIISGDHFGG